MKKNALILGGSGAIGENLARALLARGFHVTVASRNPGKVGEDLSLTSKLEMDLRSEASINEAFDRFEKRDPELDFLINCAGTGIFKPFEDLADSEILEVLKTNLVGSFIATKRAYLLMKKRGGRIIQLGSVAEKQPLADNSVYTASKAGLRGMAQVLATEGASFNINITHMYLGAVWSELWESRAGFKSEDMLKPADVSRAILEIMEKPLGIRLDELTLLPPKGIL